MVNCDCIPQLTSMLIVGPFPLRERWGELGAAGELLPLLEPKFLDAPRRLKVPESSGGEDCFSDWGGTSGSLERTGEGERHTQTVRQIWNLSLIILSLLSLSPPSLPYLTSLGSWICCVSVTRMVRGVVNRKGRSLTSICLPLASDYPVYCYHVLFLRGQWQLLSAWLTWH